VSRRETVMRDDPGGESAEDYFASFGTAEVPTTRRFLGITHRFNLRFLCFPQ
jgi:hypothetical protein